MQNKKEAISITIDKDLVEMLTELEKREGRSRSAIINAHLRNSLPYALGKKPIAEGVPSELSARVSDLEARVEKLERLGVKVTFLPEKKEG